MSEATPRAPEAADRPPEGPVHPRPPTPLPPARKARELPKRLLSAAILIPTVVYVITLGGIAYLATVIVIILLGQREIYALIEDKGAHPLVGFGLAAGAALPVVAFVGTEYHATILMTVTLLAVMVLQLRKAQITEALASISGTFFGVFYVGWLLSHAIVLRDFHKAVTARFGAGVTERLGIAVDAGIFLMLFTLTIVILCDAGAYFAGRAYGKRKLAPKISPGKSVEGAIGGVLVGTVGGLAAKGVFEVFWPELSHFLGWIAAAVLGVLISVVSILGDLIESLLKRDARVKDAGKLLPGMGGMLDRIDSNLLGIPVMYYLLLCYVFIEVANS
ncbi:MAG: phosphatidate cytidylyltransferase [Myxococcales bacterium]|nr:phosphatidate cytidylyltransferase [Myxococcales bacterium]